MLFSIVSGQVVDLGKFSLADLTLVGVFYSLIDYSSVRLCSENTQGAPQE